MKPKTILMLISMLLLATAFIYFTKALFVLGRPKKKIEGIQKRVSHIPAISERFKNPKVAIVMDDFGYNMNVLDEIFDINQPITFSILPNLKYSSDIAGLARSKGYEVILHLPLESHRKDVREETDTINSDMKKDEVVARLEAAIGTVPGLSGLSNHMGSKATEDKGVMTVILDNLKKKRLYFLDSLVTRRSVCQKIANRLSVPYAKRDIFLDNMNDSAYIKSQILNLRRMAFRRGCVVAICHDRPDTIKVLAEMMPTLSSEGIRFVFLSELVK